MSFKLQSKLAQYPLVTCVSVPQSFPNVCDSGQVFYSQSHLSQNCCFHLIFTSAVPCGAHWLARNPSSPFFPDEHPLPIAHGLCECSDFGQVEVGVHIGHSCSIIQIHLAPLSFMYFFPILPFSSLSLLPSFSFLKLTVPSLWVLWPLHTLFLPYLLPTYCLTSFLGTATKVRIFPFEIQSYFTPDFFL